MDDLDRRGRNIAVLFFLVTVCMLSAIISIVALVCCISNSMELQYIKHDNGVIRDSLDFERMRVGELEELLIIDVFDHES